MRRLFLFAFMIIAMLGLLGVGMQRPVQNTRLMAPEPVPQPPPVPVTRWFAVPVLMYHRICDLTPREARSPLMRDLTVSPENFDRQMRYLAEHDFTVVTVEEIARALRDGLPLPERAVALTMDDGYRDNFTDAFPILRKYGMPATVFLVTSTVDTAGHLRWDDAHAMQRRVGFQSHTVHHYDLTTLPDDRLDTELRESKTMIEQQLSRPVAQLAYPSGAYNDTVMAHARLAGYDIGWKKGGGPVTPGCDPYLLPRIRVNGCTPLKEFVRRVNSGVYVIQQQNREHNL